MIIIQKGGIIVNKDKIIEYFKSGCKSPGTMKLGIEIEHFIVDKDTMRSINYYEEHGIEDILKRFIKIIKGEPIYSEGRLVGILTDDYNITIEPAAQFEISMKPCLYIDEIMKIYKGFIKLLSPILDEYGYKLVNLGYHPVSSIKDLPLIPTKRYKYFDKYFSDINADGAKVVMKGTASVQASIDYYNEEDFINKYRLAYFLGPVIKLLTENTPVFEGKKNNDMFKRSSCLWNDVDESRCGIIPNIFEEGFGFDSYADFVMDIPIVFNKENNKIRYVGERTPNMIWNEDEVTIDNIEQILSMALLDVRLKKYIEIRFADSMPMEYMLSYATFIKGLFIDKENIKHILKKYEIREKNISAADENIRMNRFSGMAYGENICNLSKELLDISKMSINHEESSYLDSFYDLIDSRKTIAERWTV